MINWPDEEYEVKKEGEEERREGGIYSSCYNPKVTADMEEEDEPAAPVQNVQPQGQPAAPAQNVQPQGQPAVPAQNVHPPVQPVPQGQQFVPPQPGQPALQGQQPPYGGPGYPYGNGGYVGGPGVYYPRQEQNYYGQNSYYGNGAGGMPPYGGPNVKMPGTKPPMSTGTKILIGIAVGFGVLYLIANLALVYFMMNRSMTLMQNSISEAVEEGPGEDGSAYVPYYEEESGDAGDGDEADYVPSPKDEYYYGPCDFINEDVSYSFEWKSYTNQDEENDIDILINYVLLKGDSIPNLENVNKALEQVSMYYAEDFPKESYFAEYGESYQAYITPYVTYNDENIVSIVLDEYIAVDDIYHSDLYSINIDVKNGVILDNTSILDIDREFASEFKKRSAVQNGEVEALTQMSDEQIQEYLTTPGSAIAFYTPLGMEIGYNYNIGSTMGWITVTYKDYTDYIKRF